MEVGGAYIFSRGNRRTTLASLLVQRVGILSPSLTFFSNWRFFFDICFRSHFKLHGRRDFIYQLSAPSEWENLISSFPLGVYWLYPTRWMVINDSLSWLYFATTHGDNGNVKGDKRTGALDIHLRHGTNIWTHVLVHWYLRKSLQEARQIYMLYMRVLFM